MQMTCVSKRPNKDFTLWRWHATWKGDVEMRLIGRQSACRVHRDSLAAGSGSHRIIASIAKKLTHIRTGSVAGIINREE